MKRYLPWISLFAVWILWGSTYLAIRVGVETIPPYLMIGVRYLIAGVLLLAIQWAFAKEKPAFPTLRELGRITVTGVLLLVLGNGILAVCETRVPSGISALLLASTPIWMVVLEALRLRERISVSSIAGIVIGSIGMILLVGEPGGRTNVPYALLILFSGFAWALGTLNARATERPHPFTVPLEMAVGGSIAIVVGLSFGEATHLSLSAISLQSWFGMLWLITGGALAGYSAYTYAVRTLPMSTVATFSYVNPIVAVILGAAILHEPITLNVIAGGIAVVASVVVILLGNRRPEVEEGTALAQDAVA